MKMVEVMIEKSAIVKELKDEIKFLKNEVAKEKEEREKVSSRILAVEELLDFNVPPEVKEQRLQEQIDALDTLPQI